VMQVDVPHIIPIDDELELLLQDTGLL